MHRAPSSTADQSILHLHVPTSSPAIFTPSPPDRFRSMYRLPDGPRITIEHEAVSEPKKRPKYKKPRVEPTRLPTSTKRSGGTAARSRFDPQHTTSTARVSLVLTSRFTTFREKRTSSLSPFLAGLIRISGVEGRRPRSRARLGLGRRRPGAGVRPTRRRGRRSGRGRARRAPRGGG